ncbi:hypothetical protein DFAR_1260016 [Desulfarculales bacterium]
MAGKAFIPLSWTSDVGPGMRKWPKVVEHPRPRETGITPCHLVVAIVFFVAACVKKIMELERRLLCPHQGVLQL